MRTRRSATILALAILSGGCASVPPPRAEIGKAEAALSSARKERAGTYAPLSLHRAQAKLDGAKSAVRGERNERALRLAQQAQLDAELAELEAERERTRQSAAELERTVQALREEIDDAVD